MKWTYLVAAIATVLGATIACNNSSNDTPSTGWAPTPQEQQGAVICQQLGGRNADYNTGALYKDTSGRYRGLCLFDNGLDFVEYATLFNQRSGLQPVVVRGFLNQQVQSNIGGIGYDSCVSAGGVRNNLILDTSRPSTIQIPDLRVCIGQDGSIISQSALDRGLTGSPQLASAINGTGTINPYYTPIPNTTTIGSLTYRYSCIDNTNNAYDIGYTPPQATANPYLGVSSTDPTMNYFPWVAVQRATQQQNPLGYCRDSASYPSATIGNTSGAINWQLYNFNVRVTCVGQIPTSTQVTSVIGYSQQGIWQLRNATSPSLFTDGLPGTPLQSLGAVPLADLT